MNYILAVVFALGFASGLRSLAPAAVVAWAAHLGWLNLNNSPLGFMASIIAVIIFSVLAVVELIGDVLPQTSKRTAPVPLTARILMGGLCGACICAASNQSLIIGAIVGAVGGLLGAFAGYETRETISQSLEDQRYFHRLARGLSHDRTRLSPCDTLTRRRALTF